MNKRLRIVAIVCIAVFALTAIAAVPMFATFDAQTPADPLFGALPPVFVPSGEDVVLPAAPAADVQSSRAPPLA